MAKLKIGVLMGGKSIEKEVSFNSGRTICDHLDTNQYEVVPIFQEKNKLYILPWRFLHRGKTTDFVHRLADQADHVLWHELKNHIDFMYIAVHGRYAEDGTLQGFLELLGIPYLGSDVFTSALCMDKIIQKKFLRMAGIAVPRDVTLTAHEACTITRNDLMQKLHTANLTLPCIVKPHKEGSSLGISLAQTDNELMDAITHAATITPAQPQSILIEECLTGMEFSCITLTDYKTGTLLPLPPTEIVPEDGSAFFDYDQKYMPGRAQKFTPARCTPEIINKIQNACIATTHALGIKTISRIDGFVTKDNKVVIVDPNTLSGMGPSSFVFREAAEIGMGHTDLINHVIETDLHRYGMLPSEHTTKSNVIMNTQKTRVAVLFGGRSHEKEISLESGRNVIYKLSRNTYDVLPIFVSSTMELYQISHALLVRNSTTEIESACDPTTKIIWDDLPNLCDFVFIGLHGGDGENGNVQGMLEMLGLAYNGSSVLASALCIDKYKTNQFLGASGFAVPQSILVQQGDTLEQLVTQAKLAFPLIVKPHNDGCSVMVAPVHTHDELKNKAMHMFSNGKTHALIEECIIGMELTVGVIGNDTPHALPPSQAVATADILSIEEKFLPGAGENQTPAPLTPEACMLVQKTIEQVYTAVECKGYARIDCFYQSAEQSPTGSERVVIIEINTLPGMTPATCIFHQAAEIDIKPMVFIDAIIQLGFELHQSSPGPLDKKNKRTYDRKNPVVVGFFNQK